MSINFIPPELRTFKRTEAFWARIDRRGEDECWLWKIDTQLSQGGYGAAFYGTIHTTAHRIAYMLDRGPIPEGMQILHMCEERWSHDPRRGRRCCNPYHLYAGTPQDNMDDMVRLGRQWRSKTYGGSGNPNARISDDLLRLLLQDASAPGTSQRKLGKKYGLSKSQVGNILSGRSRPDLIASLPEDQRVAIIAASLRRTRRK